MIKSRCSEKAFKITRWFHIFSIIVIIVGTSYNMYAASTKKDTGLWLPLALAIMIILRLPNQMCVANESRDGWLSVIGSVLGLISYIATCIIIGVMDKDKGDNTEGPQVGIEENEKSSNEKSSNEKSSNEKSSKNINTQTLLNFNTFV